MVKNIVAHEGLMTNKEKNTTIKKNCLFFNVYSYYSNTTKNVGI